MAAEGPDVLFDVRTALSLGNFQACINEAQKLRVRIWASCVNVGYNIQPGR